MDIPELRAIAERYGISPNPYGLDSERQIVWSIQKARGEECCFHTEKRIHCAGATCEWRSLCLRLIADWRQS